jgi:hypothetical protein
MKKAGVAFVFFAVLLGGQAILFRPSDASFLGYVVAAVAASLGCMFFLIGCSTDKLPK